MRGRCRFLLAVVGAALLASLAVPAAAAASISGATSAAAPFALFGVDADLIGKVVTWFFEKVADQLIPDELTEAGVDLIVWFCTILNPGNRTKFPHITELQAGVQTIALGFLALVLMIAVARHWIAGMTGSSVNPVEALAKCLGALFGLVLWHWAFSNTIAGVNIVTTAILNLDVVQRGLERNIEVLMLTGAAGGAVAGLGLMGLFIVILGLLMLGALFVMKVATLLLACLLYVTGPAILACYPLPEAQMVWRAWRIAALGLVLIPIGWALIFAISGALMLDVPSAAAGGGLGGAITTQFITTIAAVLTLAIAIKFALALFGAVRSAFGMLSMSGGSGGGGGGMGTLGAAAKLLPGGGQLAAAGAAAAARAGQLAAGVGAGASAAGHQLTGGALRGGMRGVASRALSPTAGASSLAVTRASQTLAKMPGGASVVGAVQAGRNAASTAMRERAAVSYQPKPAVEAAVRDQQSNPHMRPVRPADGGAPVEQPVWNQAGTAHVLGRGPASDPMPASIAQRDDPAWRARQAARQGLISEQTSAAYPGQQIATPAAHPQRQSAEVAKDAPAPRQPSTSPRPPADAQQGAPPARGFAPPAGARPTGGPDQTAAGQAADARSRPATSQPPSSPTTSDRRSSPAPASNAARATSQRSPAPEKPAPRSTPASPPRGGRPAAPPASSKPPRTPRRPRKEPRR